MSLARRWGKEGFQALRFIAVGAAATLTHMAVASVLYQWWDGQLIFLANLLAWLVAFCVSFWGHQHVTFRRRTTFRRFLALSLSGLAVNNLLLFLLLRTPLDAQFALIGAVGLAAVVTYLLARLYTFASPPAKCRRKTP
ncbi:GtrA family protein [Halomonas sp. ANAO-440]|uniref:GtrA family protein n=1 Tax=Halomonas sp. ANAO-440 TaxID=2861360 RepID=UPI001CAA7A17|nr:GtrA family protein [Halomonas sp. ANAO-440]MBZ0329361.1 GtrA family protein [Halomonas sp. ANAO-440]